MDQLDLTRQLKYLALRNSQYLGKKRKANYQTLQFRKEYCQTKNRIQNREGNHKLWIVNKTTIFTFGKKPSFPL